MLLFGFHCTIWVFWAFYAVLLQIRFVVIYAFFGKNYFGSNLARVKKFFFVSVGKTIHNINKNVFFVVVEKIALPVSFHMPPC